MNPEAKHPSDASRMTIPKHVLDRIENEWQQMRTSNASPAPATAPQDDRR